MHDPYAKPPGTPMPPPLDDPYAKAPGTPMPGSSNDRSHEGSDTHQVSRQHLRDLLQKQQVRRQQGNDPSGPPARLWQGIVSFYFLSRSFFNSKLNILPAFVPFICIIEYIFETKKCQKPIII